MNKIVRENPASKLPEDLRPTDDPDARVTVTIEEEPSGEEQRPERVMTLEEIFAASAALSNKGGNRRRHPTGSRRVG
jgi:hypothetical protein